MNNLTKSILIVNQLLGAVMGNNFTTPAQIVLEEHPGLRYLV